MTFRYVTPARKDAHGFRQQRLLDHRERLREISPPVRQGRKDEAYLYDSTGNDLFHATPTYGKLYRTNGYLSQAKMFDMIYAEASNGGTDQAFLYDSTRDGDVYDGRATSAKLSGAGYANSARYFDAVYGYSTGGRDSALLVGSIGNDTFTGRPDYSVLKGSTIPTTSYSNYYHCVKKFKTVTSIGGNGSDYANLYDSTAPIIERGCLAGRSLHV